MGESTKATVQMQHYYSPTEKDVHIQHLLLHDTRGVNGHLLVFMQQLRCHGGYNPFDEPLHHGDLGRDIVGCGSRR